MYVTNFFMSVLLPGSLSLFRKVVIVYLLDRLTSEVKLLFNSVAEDARRAMDRRLSTGANQSLSQNIVITKPPTLGTLDTDSPVGTPGSLGSTPPASPSLASPPTCKCTFFKEAAVTLRQLSCCI